MPANDPDPNELVYIKHAGIKALGGPVTRHALDSLWSRKDWKEATAAEVAKAEAEADQALNLTEAQASAGKAG